MKRNIRFMKLALRKLRNKDIKACDNDVNTDFRYYSSSGNMDLLYILGSFEYTIHLRTERMSICETVFFCLKAGQWIISKKFNNSRISKPRHQDPSTIPESQKFNTIIEFFPGVFPLPKYNQFTYNKEIHTALISAQVTILPNPPFRG